MLTAGVQLSTTEKVRRIQELVKEIRRHSRVA